MKLRRPISIVLSALLGLLAAGSVQAQIHVPVYTGTPLMISVGTVTQQTLNRQIDAAYPSGGRSSAKAEKPAPQAVSTRLSGSAEPRMPARMAAHSPPGQRGEAERLYLQLLERHPQLMRQLGVPADDVAASVATFLAGSYIAYRNVDFPDRQFKPLYHQVRAILGSDSSFARASEAERREMHEEMAILGTHLALTHEALKQRPDAQASAQLKAAAKDYLQRFMKVNPDRLRLTDQGLTVN